MDSQLWQVRLQAFGLEALSLVGSALGAVLLSEDFRLLVTTHFGESVTASIILLVVTGGVKHLRNIKALKRLGASDGQVNLL